MPLLERASEALAERLPEGAKAHASTIIVVAGASVGFYTLRKLTRKIYRTNPFKFGNTGALAPDAIKDGISSYDAFFAQSKGKGIEDNQVAGKAKSNTPEFVDKFYRRAGACVKGGGRVGAHGGRSPSEPARLSCAAPAWQQGGVCPSSAAAEGSGGSGVGRALQVREPLTAPRHTFGPAHRRPAPRGPACPSAGPWLLDWAGRRRRKAAEVSQSPKRLSTCLSAQAVAANAFHGAASCLIHWLPTPARDPAT
jgi:hypothetical protein